MVYILLIIFSINRIFLLRKESYATTCARTSFSSLFFPLKIFSLYQFYFFLNYNYNYYFSLFLILVISSKNFQKDLEHRPSNDFIEKSSQLASHVSRKRRIARTRIRQKGERFEKRFWKGGKTLYAYTRSWYTLSDCFFSVWKSTHCGVGRATVARQIYFWLRLLGNGVCSHDR